MNKWKSGRIGVEGLLKLREVSRGSIQKKAVAVSINDAFVRARFAPACHAGFD
jgi:hypothetical protein